MEFLQSVNISDLTLLALGCACLCGVGIVLTLGLQVIGGVFEIFSSIFGLFFEVLSGGPVAWCGCIVLLVVCGGGTVLAVILAQGLAACGTPEAINFCALFGR